MDTEYLKEVWKKVQEKWERIIQENWLQEIKRYRWWLVSSGVGVLLLGIWFIPPLHDQIGKAARGVMATFGSGEVQAAQTADPLSEAIQKVTEQLTNVQQQLAELQKQQATDHQSLADAQTEFQQSSAEIAQSSEEWQHQAEQTIKQSLKEAGVTISSLAPSSPASGTKTGNSVSSTSSSDGKVNINTAGLTELENLPGIGPSYAQRIIDYRKQNGKFAQIEDLMNIKGIKQALFDKVKAQVKV